MNEPNPIQRHRQAMADARKFLAEIDEAMTQMEGARLHGPTDWADVGDANHLRDDLKELADRLLGRGEYAS